MPAVTQEWLDEHGYTVVRNPLGRADYAVNQPARKYILDLWIGDDAWAPLVNGYHVNRVVPFAETVTVTLPPKFFDDHLQRELPGGAIISLKSKSITVVLDRQALRDLKSDADYYASFWGQDRTENLGVCVSAAATLKRLKDVELA